MSDHFSRADLQRRFGQLIDHAAVAVIAGFLLALTAACGNDAADTPESALEPDASMAPETVVTSTPGFRGETRVTPTATASETSAGQIDVGPSGHYERVRIAEDGTKHLIPLNEILTGGPPKDGIPSIDQPLYMSVQDANGEQGSFDGDGLVISVEVDGKRRAYPFQILVWHELVNDTFESRPLLISYCPLCGSAIVFEREINGEPVEFGVSGKLYNSDLLMYDRHTDSYWSQITGTAVVGELTGTQLTFYPSEIMTWDAWRETYPDSEILTRDTGHDRDYDRDPYGSYYTSEGTMFPVGETDDRLHPKTRVSGVAIDERTFGAYPDDMVIEHGPVNDTLGDMPLVVVADPTAGDNIVVFDRRVAGRDLTFRRDGEWLIDNETETRWSFAGEAVDGELAGSRLRARVLVKGFWFAWYAFHQDTALWLPD